MAKIEVDKDKCKGCGLCMEFCPKKIIIFSDDLNKKGVNYAKQINPEECTACKACGLMCPDAIIEVYK